MKHPRLRSAHDVMMEAEIEDLYAIVIEKSSPLYARKNFPKPMKNWLEQHCPDVKIESLQPKIVGYVDDSLGETLKLSGATFLVDFSKCQADTFVEAWNTHQLAEMSRDVWLVNLSRSTHDHADQANTY